MQPSLKIYEDLNAYKANNKKISEELEYAKSRLA
jgi:hypothetical protein